MILIQSNKDDSSTNNVLDWIFFLRKDKNVLRLNESTLINSFSYRVSNKYKESVSLKSDKGNWNNEEIDSFWYRRGEFDFYTSHLSNNNPLYRLLNSKIKINTIKEQKDVIDQIYRILNKTKADKINEFQENLTNKISNLSFARQASLAIPDTLITNNWKKVKEFVDFHRKIISKDIKFHPIIVPYNDDYEISIRPTVQILYSDNFNQFSESEELQHFTLFQEYIEKKYELRIFYLKGQFYTMAIFSQANEKTKTDFRNYDEDRPNRCIPYQLPKQIEKKLCFFMKSIDMNCGSIDMIYTPEGEYVFLEVNPIGQFQWLSRNCNYDIERQIALDLIKDKTWK